MGIGVNGLGRIGRLVLRRLLEREGTASIYAAAINSLYPADTIAHLLRYDSVHGRLDADVTTENGNLVVNGRLIQVTCEPNPEHIPWAAMNVSTVIESTGQFNHFEGSRNHLTSGARHVVVTAPARGMDMTVVKGVNEADFDASLHRLVSTASCTTNCVAPVLHALDRTFGVREGWVTAVHAYTNDQRHLDNPHRDLRRARSCTQSIVPTSTGIGEALREVMPHLSQSIHGLSLRVPIPDVSVADMTISLACSATVADLRAMFVQLQQSAGHIVGITDEPLVSVDFVGDDRSAIIDELSLAAFGNQVKLLAWYDNEWDMRAESSIWRN